MNPFHVSKEQVIEKNIAALGSSSMKKLSNEEVIALGQYLGSAPLLDTIPCFQRVRIHGSVYHSFSYKRVTAHNSYTTLYQDSVLNHAINDLLIGQVEFYFQYQLPCTNSISCLNNCVCPVQNLALVCDFPKIPGFKVQITAAHLPKLKSLKVIPISTIQEKLVFMHFKGEATAFVSPFPNRVESD